jgi:hypothetical protein
MKELARGLQDFQERVDARASTLFGGRRDAGLCLDSIVDEVLGLSHAHGEYLVGEGGMKEKCYAAKVSTIGLIIISLAEYCSLEDIDLWACVIGRSGLWIPRMVRSKNPPRNRC